MKPIPSMNLFGRQNPYVQQPYLPDQIKFKQPPYFQEDPQYVNRDEISYPQHHYYDQQQRQPVDKSNPHDPLFYKSQMEVQQQGKVLQQNNKVPSQYGPPLEFYETKDMRKSLQKEMDQKLHQPQSTKDQIYPNYQAYQASKFDLQKNNSDYDKQEELAPMINFFPPEDMTYQQNEDRDQKIDQFGRLNQYQQNNDIRQVNETYTQYIQQQIQSSNNAHQSSYNIKDRSLLRQRWEVKEIYGNLQATFDVRGNICFNNIQQVKNTQTPQMKFAIKLVLQPIIYYQQPIQEGAHVSQVIPPEAIKE